MVTKAFEMKRLLMTAAVGALMLPSIGWGEADGRGHNGPNLAPTSIPVELDHGINADQVQEAINVCYATGDSKSGVVSLLQRLVDELTGGHGKDLKYEYATSVFENNQMFGNYIAIISNMTSGFYGGRFLEGGIDYVRFCAKFPLLVEPSGFDVSDGSCSQVSLLYPGRLPEVRYNSVVQDSGYDEYGREVKGARILMGVSIQVDPAAYGPSIRLTNSQTHVKSAVTVNTIEYVECLKSELQKRAE